MESDDNASIFESGVDKESNNDNILFGNSDKDDCSQFWVEETTNE